MLHCCAALLCCVVLLRFCCGSVSAPSSSYDTELLHRWVDTLSCNPTVTTPSCYCGLLLRVSTPWLYLEGAASSCRNSRTARSLFGVSVLCSAPSSSRYRWPKPLAQTGLDPGMRLRGDLPKWRASSLDWCANPPGDRRECGRGANRFGSRHEIACCVRRPPRVTVVVPTPRVIAESVDVHRLVQS